MNEQIISIQREIGENYKVFFEIISTIILTIIAILTYINAKRTFFSPFKNEVFKKQINEISMLYEYFQSTNEIDLIKKFGLDETKILNIINLLDDYAIYQKWMPKSEIKKRPYAKCSHFIFSKEYAEKFLKFPLEESNDEQNEISNWNEYIYGKLAVSNKTVQKLEELDKFINSPFLPKTLKEKIISIKKWINDYEKKLMIELTNVSKEVPKYAKQCNDLNEVCPYLENLLNHNIDTEEILNITTDILATIEKYLKTNEIFN